MAKRGPGDHIGGYAIERLVGRGGMGEVFLARDERLGRKVALKVIVSDLADDEQFRARFVREARVATALEHPNVVPVHDVGEDDGALFIAMRFVDGVDLGATITRDGPFDRQRAGRVVEQVCAALDAAHAAGLVHRDVKPANVLLTGRLGHEHAYLTDFGLAREMDGASALTRTDQWVGTLDYVAPEQVEGRDLDARTDVYAVACVAFQLLTGAVPFLGTAVSKLHAHLRNPRPRVTEQRPQLPAEVDGVVARGMAIEPAERPASAGAFADELVAALAARSAQRTRVETRPEPEPEPVRPPEPPPEPWRDPEPRRPRRWRPVALGAAALAVVIAIVVGIAAATGGDPTAGAGAGGSSGQSAPALDAATAQASAQDLCRQIDQAPATTSPYRCTGASGTRPDGAGFVSDLQLNDPSDGERCVGVARTVATPQGPASSGERGTCLADPLPPEP